MVRKLIAAIAACVVLESAVLAEGPRLLVILDPGHGGEDAGAIQKLGSRVVAEKDVTLAIALATRKILESHGIPTVLTRSSDTFVSLDLRPEIANAAAEGAKSAVFISIHVNSSDENNSSGIETYVFNASSNQASRRLADLENGRRFSQSRATLELIVADLESTANFSDSVHLACSVQQQAKVLARRNRGIHQALFYVLMQTHMPSILFEAGFLSNPKELSLLSGIGYQNRVASALSDGVLRWALQTKHPITSSVSGISKTHCRIR